MMPKKKILWVICPAVALTLLFITVGVCLSQIKSQRVRSSVKNSVGGYDFYSPSGKVTGYSKPNRKGGYDYYDKEGNKIGSLRQKDESGRVYTYYDAEGISRGTLKRRSSGIYYYQDRNSGSMVDSIPEHEGEPGSLSPQVFQGEE